MDIDIEPGVTYASTSTIETDSHRPSSICPKLSSNASTPNTDDIPGHFSTTKHHHSTSAQTIAGFGYGSLNPSLADSGTCIHAEYRRSLHSVHEGTGPVSVEVVAWVVTVYKDVGHLG